MTRFLVFSTLSLSTLATSALAGISAYAPDKRIVSRGEVAAICSAMGETGKLFATADGYGCQNQVNGNALVCTADGQCTDHTGDPRWRRIKDLIDGRNRKQRLVPL